MTKYTAADFANAKFAEHPNGGTARTFPQTTAGARWSYGGAFVLSDEQMADEGWVPVIPARTITDPEMGAIADNTSDDWLDGFMAGYEKAGGTILEETTRERVARLVNEAVDGRGIVPVGEKVADRLIGLGLVKGN